MSQMSTNLDSTPSGSRTFISRLTVAPYNALAATTNFRRSVSAVRIAT